MKKVIISVLGFLLVISVLQVLPVPPYSNEMFPVFRSEYYSELDRNAAIVLDSFLSIKMYSKTEAAWVFLDDLEKKYSFNIDVYNKSFKLVQAPGYSTVGMPGYIKDAVAAAGNSSPRGKIKGSRYLSILPVKADKRCRICHSVKDASTIGVFTLERDMNPYMIYSVERVALFSLLSMFILTLLILIWRWDPNKKIKELFDKK